MLITALRRITTVCVFALAFVVNPLYVAGCISSDDEEADKAEAEARLLDSLDGVNDTGSWSFSFDGDEYELLLELSQVVGEDKSARAPAQARFMPVAHACGQHTFFQSASACDTLYELAVEGTLTLRRVGASPHTVAADVPVSGMLRDFGDLSLSVGDGGELSLDRRLSDGTHTLSRFTASDLGTEALDVSFDSGG